MQRFRFILPVVILVSVIVVSQTAHAASYSVSSPWRYGEKVVITGDHLEGDRPDYKKLCIAPEGVKEKKECYYDFQLNSATWSDSKISFYPPEEVPIRGIIILQLEEAVEKCYGSAGCITTHEDMEKEVGSFTLEPYISTVFKLGSEDEATTAYSIEPLSVYQVQGKYFDDSKGSIFLRQPRGTKQVAYDKIASWSSTSIVFSAPPDIETANGISVNNGAVAKWFEFPTVTTVSSSSSSKRQQIDKSKYPQSVQEELDALDKETAQKMLVLLQDSQATVDRYAPKINKVGTPSDAVCKSLNDRDTTSSCQALCAAKTEKICLSVCEKFPTNPECSTTCYAYKKITDSEKECVSSCLTECVAGTECVCESGRVNKDAYRDYVMAKRSLASGYKMLYEDDDADKDLVAALKKELDDAGLQLIKNGDSISLVKRTDGLFSDVTTSHPYNSAIQWAKQEGVLQGYPDGSFKPDNTVNRAEFLKIVLAAKGINVSETSSNSSFKDVDENGWYAPYVRYAKAQGIIQGYPDGSFKPNQAVNFAEALKMAYNALGVTTNEIGGDWYERFLQHAKINDVLFTSDARVNEGMSRKDVIWIVWKLMTHNGNWQQPTKTSATPSESPSSSVQFKDGTYVVGTDIQAGTYRTRKGLSGCYFARLSGFSGELDDIINNELTNTTAIVTIDASDKGFKSTGCGTWTQDLSAITTSRTSFGDGTFIVGTDIDAGTFKNSGGSTCYYSRLSGFSGELDDIISNELTSASAIVTIDASDKGFKSSHCGTWARME